MSKGIKCYRFSGQQTLFDAPTIIGFGSDDWHIEEINRDLANLVIKKNHYSRKVYNATYIHLGVFIAGEMLGVLQYGYAMNPASGGSVVEGTALNEYLELNRMWLDDRAARNSESKAISYSFKYIRGRYPKVKWVQSFADERCGGFGIVYQACSFDFYGEHSSIFWTLDGEVFHNSLMTRDPKLSVSAAKLQANKDSATSETIRQFRYIRFIDRSWQKKCRLERKPYLKHYNGD